MRKVYLYKKFFLVSLIIAQSCIAFAQDSVQETQFPITENGALIRFYYFNNEWIAMYELVQTDSIKAIEIKNDEYGNRACFCTVSPEYLAHVKSESRKYLINLDPRCEFPGGNEKLIEWLEANIRIPKGYKGRERVVVNFIVQPDGTITKPEITRPSKNEAANAEALRLASAMPKFNVTYFTPKKHQIRYILPITFKEPGVLFMADKFPKIKAKIMQLYENLVFETAKDPSFNIADICTAVFIKRLERANDTESKGYATWLLRSGMQDGDDTTSKVTSIAPGANNTVIVRWSDMGHRGSTTFSMIETDGEWKINNATVPEGYNPL